MKCARAEARGCGRVGRSSGREQTAKACEEVTGGRLLPCRVPWRQAVRQLALHAHQLELRALLDQESYDGITSLGRKLHALHHRLPDYRRLSTSPFNVTAWWDPENEDPEWNSGRSCLFTIDGYTSKEFISYLPDRTNLKLRAVTSHFIEAYVPPDLKNPDQEAA